MSVYKDEDMKLLFAIVKLSDNLPVGEVATFMGLKKGATNMRIRRLLEKLEDQFGAPTPTPAPAPANLAPKKRKKVEAKAEFDEDDAAAAAAYDDEGEVKKKAKK